MTEAATPLPVGLRFAAPLGGGQPTWYDIRATAVYSGQIQVYLSYAGLQVVKPATLRLLHYDTAAKDWEQTQSVVNQSTQTICGGVSSLSPFAIAEETATATTVTGSVPSSVYGTSVTFTETHRAC
jgi:hypothetical protein